MEQYLRDPPGGAGRHCCGVTMFVSYRCSNLTGGWRSLSAASEGGALQENVTITVEERGITQVTSDVISVMSSERRRDSKVQ